MQTDSSPQEPELRPRLFCNGRYGQRLLHLPCSSADSPSTAKDSFHFSLPTDLNIHSISSTGPLWVLCDPPKPPIWMHGRGTYTGLRRARVITHTLTDPAQGQVAHVACPRVTVCPWSTWQHPKTDGRFLRGPDPRGKGAPPPEGSLIKHSRSNYPVLPPRSSKQDQF